MSAFDAFAPYYDRLYRDKNYGLEAAFVITELVVHAGECYRILDLGCGTGGHLVEFAKWGVSTHGIDASAAMVAIAKGKGLSVECKDVRAFNDPAGTHYDAVVSLFHVASYLLTDVDLTLFFNTARRHLKSRGLFIFDFWYGPAVLNDPPVSRTKQCKSADTVLSRLAEPMLIHEDNQVRIEYLLGVNSVSGARQETLMETHTLRYWFLPELRDLLSGCGFKIVSEHVGLDRYDGKIVARCA